MPRAVAAVLVSLVHSTDISNCEWSDGKLQVTWASPKDEPADYYEVQVSNDAGGSIFAVHSTEQNAAQLDFLTADRSFWLKVRAHKAGMPSLGPGTWLEPGSEIECKTGSYVARRAGAVAATDAAADTMLLEVMRQSEFTYDVDYLMNHDSGDLSGDVSFIVHSSHDTDQPGFLNVTFRKSVFTLYCLEVLAVSVPDTITTDADTRFADYLSCNDNHNATDPQCQCDNAIDRSLSKSEDQMKYCHKASGEPCATTTGYMRDCTCDCTDASLAMSARYTGMMPVYFSQPELLGHWYSHPKDTECSESERVGTVRADGTVCTWKRHPEARVVRGGDALDFGWNITSGGGHHSGIDVAQVRENTAVLRRLFDSQPFQQWTCGESLGAPVIV